MRTPILSALTVVLTLVAANSASAQSPAGYIRVQGAFINGSGIGTARTGMTVASCAAACTAEPRCLSFEMYGDETCSLNAANRQSRPNILTRSELFTYYEKAQAPASEQQLFIYQNCANGVTRCTLGVAEGGYAQPGNARWREGWRAVVDQGPFSNHPSAWRRLCSLHNPPSRVAPDIVAGRVNCGELGVTPRGSGGGTSPSGGGTAGYTVVEGAFINGRGIGQARPGQTPASCAALCNAEPRCLSFELYDGALCGLNAASRNPNPDILTRSPRYRYYERISPPRR